MWSLIPSFKWSIKRDLKHFSIKRERMSRESRKRRGSNQLVVWDYFTEGGEWGKGKAYKTNTRQTDVPAPQHHAEDAEKRHPHFCNSGKEKLVEGGKKAHSLEDSRS